MRVDFSTNAGRVSRAIERIIVGVSGDPLANQHRYEDVMRRGTDRHFARLGWGGMDSAALGTPVSWSTSRHPITMRRRRGKGFPLLDSGRGFMRRGFTTGSGTSSRLLGREGVQLTYTARGTRERALGRVHQLGLPPINASAQGFDGGFTVPVRQFLYWDNQMHAETVRNLRRALIRLKAGARA